MRKITVIGGVLVLAAAGWSALWYTGRSEIADRLDLELSRLEARGVEVSHAGREIGGFPFGYKVRYADLQVRDPASGIEARLPELSAEGTPSEPDKVTVLFPPAFSILAPEPAVAAPARGEDAGEAELLEIEIESEALTLGLSGTGGQDRVFDLDAVSVMIIHAREGQARNGAVELIGLDSRLAVPPRPDLGEARLTLAAERIDYVMQESPGEGGESRAEGTVQAVSLTGESDRHSILGVVGMLAGTGTGNGKFTYQTGPSEVAGMVTVALPEGAEAGAPTGGAVTIANGASGGVLEIEDGRFRFSGTSENNRWELLPHDEDAAVRGAIAVDRIETVYESPVAPSEEMQPVKMRLALGKIRPDETFWQAVDPEAALPRTPGEVIVDLEGTARLLPPAGAGAQGIAMPELGNITLRTVEIALLDAEVSATGDVEFIQPINIPKGSIDVKLTRVMPVIGKLVAAGLIGIPEAQAAMMMAANFTRPGENPDELLIGISVSEDGVAVNGQPVLRSR